MSTDVSIETAAIGRRIRELRESSGLSQESLGNELGLDKSGVSRIENGERGITATEVGLAAQFFQVTSDELLYGERDQDEILLRADGDASSTAEFATKVVEDYLYVEALVG